MNDSSAQPVLGVALVLAAGRGVRMGGPKALMPVGRELWVDVQRRRLENAGVDTVWVVSKQVRAGLRRRAENMDLVEADSDAPMFESLLTGLRFVRARAPKCVFVLPVDTPAPRPDVFTSLFHAGSVAAPEFRGQAGHPIVLPWTWVEDELFTREVSFAPADRRLDVLTRPHIRMIAVDDPDVSVNLNTPENMKAWLDAGSASGAPSSGSSRKEES